MSDKKTRSRRIIDPETEAMLKGVASAIEETLNKGLDARWHRVEDRLPENGQMVVTLCGNYLGEAHITFNECFAVATFCKSLDYEDGEPPRRNVFCTDTYDYCDGDVTHWAPLPKLPKELLTKIKEDTI